MLEYLSKAFDYINSFDYIGISLLLMYVVLGVVLYSIHKNEHSKYFIDSLFLDENNRASTSKLAQVIALITSTWAFIHLTLDSKLTEWFFIGYGSLWVANRQITNYIDMKSKTDK